MKILSKCKNCQKCFKDYSENDYECMDKDITEAELEKHFTNGETGCKYYVAETETDLIKW